MDLDVSDALRGFTQRYVELWQQQTGHEPASEELFGVASPCAVRSSDNEVFWLPQPFTPPSALNNVERALDIQLRPEAHAYFTTQFAGDMSASYLEHSFNLVQVWSEDDFIRLQENLIGHLLTQKRLKLSPTLFLGTTDSELLLISLCNLSGEVLLEQFGSKKRTILSSSLSEFLTMLLPRNP
ncbi:SecY-interacting protein [Rouxiella badensis]|uniref:SecY-interacting protein n=1 Tax=Rouxiella badensis TaxID=1646377 RepID=UPI001D14EE58|nr:SecY-interacting protein [Rouxiella badensis]MCC3703736.1 SecY-interacting protein [Rouxiella badensis]